MLGLAFGEQSILAAEVFGSDRADVQRLAEFVFPAGLTLQQPEAMGKALAEFLQAGGFSAKVAVAGIPARWLVVKPKEVPPADRETVSDMLRLQAEGEFSSELKDLVYDYAGEPSTESAGSVLLMATPQTSVRSIESICEAARLKLLTVTSTSLALGEATEAGGIEHAVVLSVGSNGAELTARRAGMPVGVRHVRSPAVGELRRAISSLQLNGVNREMVVWDPELDPRALGQELNLAVRRGSFSDIGVASSSTTKQDEAKFAPAVALALTGLRDNESSVDFLHSRLAAKKQSVIPRWAVLAAITLIVVIGAGVYAYADLLKQEDNLATLQQKRHSLDAQLKTSEAFVSKVTFAKGWQSNNTRYLNCLRDLTGAFPEDGTTYATNFTIKEAVQSAGGKSVVTGGLSGQLFGKTSDQQRVQTVVERLQRAPGFHDVKSGGTQEVGRAREVSFSVTFVYSPDEAAKAAAAK